MPTELYGSLYGHDNLYVVMTMLKNIYGKKPQNVVAIAARVAQGATAPFTLICFPTRDSPKAQSEASLEDRISQLIKTLYCIDLNGKHTQKPFKPFITQPRWQFKPGCNGHSRCFTQPNGRHFSLEQHRRQQGPRGCFRFRRSFGKFDKSPNTKCPRVLGKPFNKDRIRCFRCKEFGHIQKDCQEGNKPHKEDNTEPKKFEHYTYTYAGPDVQPQMQMNLANPQMATDYDQALGVIKDIINTANPLASYNL